MALSPLGKFAVGAASVVAASVTIAVPTVDFIEASQPPLVLVASSSGSASNFQSCITLGPEGPTEAPIDIDDFVLSNRSKREVIVIGFITDGSRRISGPGISESDAATSADLQIAYWQKLDGNKTVGTGPFSLSPGTMIALRVQGGIELPPKAILGDGTEVAISPQALRSAAEVPNVERALQSFPNACTI